MKISDKLGEMYAGYYDLASDVARKRAVAARQTIAHIRELLREPPYESLLDIGAGEGAVLAELDRVHFARELHAVEISESGVAAIESRSLPSLRSVRQFDGYSIPAADRAYAVGTAIHVLEHVEHERAFLQEITRVCGQVYVEVPLELTARVDRAMRLSSPYGHINYYNPETFRNLLETSGLEVLSFRLFPNSREYETHVSGNVKGSVKYCIRSGLLRAAPSVATFAMAYLAGAVCRRR